MDGQLRRENYPRFPEQNEQQAENRKKKYGAAGVPARTRTGTPTNLPEGLHRRRLVVLHVENGVELGDL